MIQFYCLFSQNIIMIILSTIPWACACFPLQDILVYNVNKYIKFLSQEELQITVEFT